MQKQVRVGSRQPGHCPSNVEPLLRKCPFFGRLKSLSELGACALCVSNTESQSYIAFVRHRVTKTLTPTVTPLPLRPSAPSSAHPVVARSDASLTVCPQFVHSCRLPFLCRLRSAGGLGWVVRPTGRTGKPTGKAVLRLTGETVWSTGKTGRTTSGAIDG